MAVCATTVARVPGSVRWTLTLPILPRVAAGSLPVSASCAKPVLTYVQRERYGSAPGLTLRGELHLSGAVPESRDPARALTCAPETSVNAGRPGRICFVERRNRPRRRKPGSGPNAAARSVNPGSVRPSFPPHSLRNATTGSTLAARCAGHQQARTPTLVSTAATAAKLSGSKADTP